MHDILEKIITVFLEITKDLTGPCSSVNRICIILFMILFLKKTGKFSLINEKLQLQNRKLPQNYNYKIVNHSKTINTHFHRWDFLNPLTQL